MAKPIAILFLLMAATNTITTGFTNNSVNGIQNMGWSSVIIYLSNP